MKTINNICVYCGGRYNAGAGVYIQAARDIGQILAQQGWGLVYGAGSHGLMGALADSVLTQGGRVTGIIPSHLQDQEKKHTDLSELIVVNSMHERKQKMADFSDAFVILPGGYGTLEEALEILTWRQLGLHDKPIIFVNVNNFWEPVKQQKLRFFQEGFVTENDMTLFRVIEKPSDLVMALAEEGYATR
jgi:uncharacterized protein (TIGR00730 family)